MEEEVTAFLNRDYYERSAKAKGSRSGSKARTVKVGCDDIKLKMPQVRNTAKAFNSIILPPWVTQMKEINELIPLLYMKGISTRKVKGAVGAKSSKCIKNKR